MTGPNVPNDLPKPTRAQILIFMGITAIVLLAVAKFWQALGRVPLLPVIINPQGIGLGLGAAAAITLASGMAYRIWPAYQRSASEYLELYVQPLAWPDLLWLGLLPGMSEELLFRGVMIPAFGSGIWAIAVSSLVFGILHVSGWPYLAWATAIGIVLGVLAVATGNLLVPIVAHIAANIASGCIWKLGHRMET
ncbi:CAAX amino terminal protease family [Rubidibacter lacunae KORDI 51-2]|uniref:CAAX amino terminal protease family n=1 Tax=Rubidibacter lacunae KORDI 51-2 TaxID=582515 RepID=U5DEI9_9CHRO|nr:type II CAAX endopeptidase family protein [Rubidibacter lacunae]ERN40031.1 CAAX amino terminal protease family [Rubidibacter lacunae KORDI 51-2]